MAEKEKQSEHKSTIDKYFEPPRHTRHGSRKTRKKEIFYRLQQKIMGI
jgi:hypothetical protein